MRDVVKGSMGRISRWTPAAHKLARIIYHLVTTGQPYDETVLAADDQRTLARKTRRLEPQATALGYSLVPLEASP